MSLAPRVIIAVFPWICFMFVDSISLWIYKLFRQVLANSSFALSMSIAVGLKLHSDMKRKKMQNPYLIFTRYNFMSKGDLHHKLNTASEITLSIKGRISGKDIPRPLWFVYEGSMLYLLPVQGPDTNWYKNLLSDPMLKISVNGIEILARGQPITDSNGVDEVTNKFKYKYGEGDIKKYYTKFDVAVEVPL